jgi:selenocysteine lyase/cysteine desulfurase
MTLKRRDVLAGFGGLAASAAWPTVTADERQHTGFPRKSDFNIAEGHTYINGAYTHPMPLVASAAARRYCEGRSALGAARSGAARPDAKALFARLINAKPSEICYVPNTSTGENLVINGLGIKTGLNRGIPRFEGNVVTDSLHFDGALVHLLELKKQGLDLRIVKAKDFRIDLRDLERVVDKQTKLVEVSLVAMYNGFQHDLKEVCDLAHAHGARVYADIIQAAGAVPIDVKASGVDFCACSSFKWLMGDFGLGFFYAREDLLEETITRSQWGYHSTSDMTGHFPPFDPEADASPLAWTLRRDATGYFEVGSIGGSAEAAVSASLTYIHDLGVENIQRHRQPLLRRLRDELPRLGLTLATPEDSTSPIITFATRDGAAVEKKLQAANINARVSRYWVRFSPSVYNDMRDIERVLSALA